MAASGEAHRVHDVVLADLLDYVQSLRHLAEHGVHAIQVTRVALVQHYEELAAAGISSGVGHGQSARLVRVRVARGLAVDLPAGTAGADARISLGEVPRLRIAALDHEILDDAVELDAVIEALVG